MPICDVIKSSSQGQVSACGKLEAGALRSGFKVCWWVVQNVVVSNLTKSLVPSQMDSSVNQLKP